MFEASQSSISDGAPALREVKVEPFDLREHMFATTSNRLVRMESDLAARKEILGLYKEPSNNTGESYYKW